MFELKELVTKLSHYWWSPKPPEAYVVTGANGHPAGLGLIAYKCYASFNIVYAIHPLKTFADHREAVMAFTQLDRMLDVKVNGTFLDWWITSQSQAEFRVWYKENRSQIEVHTRRVFDKI